MSRAWPVIALAVAAVLASTGCDRRPVITAGDLPPAYTRDKILDPKLAEVARAFTAWAGEQKVQAGAAFGRVEVLPPAPTLLPYGIGTYQKQLRLPAILITGPGWRTLARDDREALAARAFQELSRLLESSAGATGRAGDGHDPDAAGVGAVLDQRPGAGEEAPAWRRRVNLGTAAASSSAPWPTCWRCVRRSPWPRSG